MMMIRVPRAGESPAKKQTLKVNERSRSKESVLRSVSRRRLSAFIVSRFYVTARLKFIRRERAAAAAAAASKVAHGVGSILLAVF